jgi:hypothetical protein
MTAVTLWILMIASQGHRPAVVVDRFGSEAACIEAKQALLVQDKYESPYCFKATVAR